MRLPNERPRKLAAVFVLPPLVPGFPRIRSSDRGEAFVVRFYEAGTFPSRERGIFGPRFRPRTIEIDRELRFEGGRLRPPGAWLDCFDAGAPSGADGTDPSPPSPGRSDGRGRAGADRCPDPTRRVPSPDGSRSGAVGVDGIEFEFDEGSPPAGGPRRFVPDARR